MTQVVSWAAGNGDRSENADYLYGKRRLRQIDSRIRFLPKRIDATVTYSDAAGNERVVSIVGIDEVDTDRRYISWRSPLARALMKSTPGDSVVVGLDGEAPPAAAVSQSSRARGDAADVRVCFSAAVRRSRSRWSESLIRENRIGGQ